MNIGDKVLVIGQSYNLPLKKPESYLYMYIDCISRIEDEHIYLERSIHEYTMNDDTIMCHYRLDGYVCGFSYVRPKRYFNKVYEQKEAIKLLEAMKLQPSKKYFYIDHRKYFVLINARNHYDENKKRFKSNNQYIDYLIQQLKNNRL